MRHARRPVLDQLEGRALAATGPISSGPLPALEVGPNGGILGTPDPISASPPPQLDPPVVITSLGPVILGDPASPTPTSYGPPDGTLQEPVVIPSSSLNPSGSFDTSPTIDDPTSLYA